MYVDRTSIELEVDYCLPVSGQWRVFKGILYHIYLQPTERTPRSLFAPMITSSTNSPYDCDYNFHKSNSTYFADLDVARAHYMGSIIRTGLTRLNAGDEDGLPADAHAAKGSYYMALGAVGCFFQREIKPMERFEIYTRLLSWDRKWLYLVSHVVRAGKLKPESHVLQPWKNKGRSSAQGKQEEEDLKKHIFATSIARYVVKKGRLTVNPEIVLERSLLLPTRPPGVGLPPRSEGGPVAATPATADTPAEIGNLTSPEQVAAGVAEKLGDVRSDEQASSDDWSWDEMEAERLRGLKMASHFDALNGLHDELRAKEALGKYSDWF